MVEPIGARAAAQAGGDGRVDPNALRLRVAFDPEIITLPSSLKWLNGPLAAVISKSRSPSSKEGYASIGGGSPQLSTTLEQGRALEEALERRGIAAKSYVAMRYWAPYTSDVRPSPRRRTGWGWATASRGPA